MPFSAQRLFATSILVCLVRVAAYAQNAAGSITGFVTDPNDAVIADATITITNRANGVTRKLSGSLSIPRLTRQLSNGRQFPFARRRPDARRLALRKDQTQSDRRRLQRVEHRQSHRFSSLLTSAAYVRPTTPGGVGSNPVLANDNFGRATARVSPIFGTGDPRAFQFAARLSF